MPKSTRPAHRTQDSSRWHPNDYSPAEDAALRTLFATAPRPEVLAALPGRPWSAIQRAAARRGIRRPRRPHTLLWEGFAIEQLHARYGKEDTQSLADSLGFSVVQIRAKAKAEGLQVRSRSKPRPARRTPRKQTAEERAAREARLAKLYPPKVAAKKAPPKKQVKEVKKPEPVLVAPVKRSPITPVLNAAKSARLASERQQKQDRAMSQIVSAAELKGVDYTHPAREAYNRAAKYGGHAASAAFREVMAEVNPTYKIPTV